MIPVIELAKALRVALGDMQGINISDFELAEAVNHAARELYEQFSNNYVQAGLKRIPSVYIDPSNTEEGYLPFYTLPDDFLKLHQVIGVSYWGYQSVLNPSPSNPPREGTYRIIGNDLYAPKGEYTIEYYYQPMRVETIGDLLDVPEGMRPYIEKIALAMFMKETEKADYLIEQAIDIYSGRELSHFEDIGPVQVLGGKV